MLNTNIICSLTLFVFCFPHLTTMNITILMTRLPVLLPTSLDSADGRAQTVSPTLWLSVIGVKAGHKTQLCSTWNLQ